MSDHEEVSFEEQRKAIKEMLDVQWSTNWSPLPDDAEGHVEQAFVHLTEVREITERETGYAEPDQGDSQ